MKRYILVLLMLVGVGAFAQDSVVDDLIAKYKGEEGVTSVVISEYMFSMFSNIDVESEEAKNVQDVTKGLKGIRILTISNPEINKTINFYSDLFKDLPSGSYKELMVVNEKDSDVRFVVKEVDSQIEELLLLIGGNEENVLIQFSGNIDLNSIVKLGASMNMQGMDQLQKLDSTQVK